MFSKTLLSSAVVGAVISTAAAGPVARIADKTPVAPADIVFAPAPPIQDSNNFIGSRDLKLTKTDNFFWDHEDEGTYT